VPLHMQFLLYGAGLLAGAVTNVATGMNASLGKGFGDHRMLAALAIQATGMMGLFLLAMMGGAFTLRPSAAELAGIPWWAWVGGAVQALTVFSVLLAAQATGAVLFGALTVTGGTLMAVLLDHYGVLGFVQHEATLLRLAGCALLVAGTVMVARG
jgi:transporter family-2 protein